MGVKQYDYREAKIYYYSFNTASNNIEIVYYIIIRNDRQEMSIDLSDIDSMNIGSEMPRLCYVMHHFNEEQKTNICANK